MQFEEVLGQWKVAAVRHVELRLAYEAAFARALLASDAKNVEGRKAAADLATTEERRAAECAEIETRALQHLVLHLRAPSFVREEAA